MMSPMHSVALASGDRHLNHAKSKSDPGCDCIVVTYYSLYTRCWQIQADEPDRSHTGHTKGRRGAIYHSEHLYAALYMPIASCV